MCVVADTGPLHYLVLIGEVALLPQLFGTIVVPGVVLGELRHVAAPSLVRDWAAAPPPWLDVAISPSKADPAFAHLDAGEAAAILLAIDLRANLMLMDDRAGVGAARSHGLAVTGTIGVLDLAARRGVVDLHVAVARLRKTSFRHRPTLLNDLLARHPAPEKP